MYDLFVHGLGWTQCARGRAGLAWWLEEKQKRLSDMIDNCMDGWMNGWFVGRLDKVRTYLLHACCD